MISKFNQLQLIPPPQLEEVPQIPDNPTYQVRFQTGTPTSNTIQMPITGPFKVSVQAGDTFAILDADATDGSAKIQMPAHVMDLYLQAQQIRTPSLCQSAYDTHKSTQAYFQQLVLNKAKDLIAQGKSQCVYQSANTSGSCQSSSSGLNCTGKSLSTSDCSEIAVLANSLSIQHDVSASKIFAYTQSDTTLKHAAKGVLSSAGNVQTDLNGNRVFEGVLVGARSQQFNLNGTPQFRGLFHLTDSQTATATLKGNSQVEGAICPSGSFNLNRNGNTRVVYQPQTLVPWLNDVGNLANVLCDAQSNLYTQTNSKSCPPPVPPASLQVKDPLYVLDQTIQANIDDSAYYLARRPVPVPADWYGPEGQNYVLEFNNQGMTAINTYWFEKNASALFPHSVQLTPKVDCVQQNRLGTYTAYLGYENAMPGSITIPTGEYNSLLPADNAGQPTQFAMGTSPSYPQSTHAVSFVGDQLTWKLGTQTLSINPKDPELQCLQEAITVPSNVSVRKTLLETTSLNFEQGQQTQTLPFNVNDPVDLKRRILLTVKTGTQGNPVDKLEVRVNGQVLLPGAPNQILVTKDSPETTFEVVGLIKHGANTLSITANSTSNSHVQARLDGFVVPIDIPGSYHSAFDHSEEMRSASKPRKGIVAIKFLEGMKVRLNENAPIEDGLHDESEISLSILNKLAKSHINKIVPAIPGTPSEHDANEAEMQNKFGNEAPNSNLYYLMTFDENIDVWRMIDTLKMQPFFEEVFPLFENAGSPFTPYEPEEVRQGFWNIAPSGKALYDPIYQVTPPGYWLMSTRILGIPDKIADKPLLPFAPHPYPSATPGPEKPFDGIELKYLGAWDYSQGNPNIITTVIEGALYKAHPDLPNIKSISNIDEASVSSGTDPQLAHATSALGIIGAKNDASGYGVAGIAHKGTTYHVQAYAPNGGSHKCLGSNKSPCNITSDSFLLALNLPNNKKSNVIVIEQWMKYGPPSTVEQYDVLLRYLILLHAKTKQEVNVILPAGNRACETIANDKKLECASNYPRGKDVRKHQITHNIYSFSAGFLTPSAILPDHLSEFGASGQLGRLVGSVVTDSPMYDTGSIIVGGLGVDGNQRPKDKDLTLPPMCYGKSKLQNVNNQIVFPDGHGTDISGPAEHVGTTSYKWDTSPPGLFGEFGGSSAAAPVVAGVVALMLDKNPNLKPADIREMIRASEQDFIPLNSTIDPPDEISGMINAYEAVKAANGSKEPEGFSTSGFDETAIASEPVTPSVSLWLLRGSSKIVVEPGQDVGIGINYPDRSGVDIQIDGQTMPIRQLANNYITFGIPQDMTPGAKDVIIKLAGGQVTLEQALEIISLAGLPKVSFTMPENTIYSNGNFWKDIYVTLRDDQGKRLPAGRPIYVSGLPTPNILTSSHQLMDPAPGSETLWTHEGLFYTDANGKIHFKYKVDGSLFQEAYRYGAFWPTPDSPNTRFRVCTYTYRSSKPGWGGDCLEQLFPSNSEPSNEGRIFWVGPASARIEPAHMDMLMNGSTYAMSITDVRDKAGNLVPDGTSVYLTYPYWITTGSGGLITPAEGQSNYIQSGGRRFARLVVRGGRANFTVTTRSIACWGGNEVTRDTLTLVGSFNSSVNNALNHIATGTIQYLAQPGC